MIIEFCGVSFFFLFFLVYLLFYSRSVGVCRGGGTAQGAKGQWSSKEGQESAPANQETTAERELPCTPLTGNRLDHTGSFNQFSWPHLR